jgi:hypothetical protein
MGSYDFIKPYNEVEPIPPNPKTNMHWPATILSWVGMNGFTWSGALFLHTVWLNLLWIPWFIAFPLAGTVNAHRVHRKWMRDMDAWEARANAHHEKVMRQIDQYAKRDWN